MNCDQSESEVKGYEDGNLWTRTTGMVSEPCANEADRLDRMREYLLRHDPRVPPLTPAMPCPPVIKDLPKCVSNIINPSNMKPLSCEHEMVWMMIDGMVKGYGEAYTQGDPVNVSSSERMRNHLICEYNKGAITLFEDASVMMVDQDMLRDMNDVMSEMKGVRCLHHGDNVLNIAMGKALAALSEIRLTRQQSNTMGWKLRYDMTECQGSVNTIERVDQQGRIVERIDTRTGVAKTRKSPSKRIRSKHAVTLRDGDQKNSAVASVISDKGDRVTGHSVLICSDTSSSMSDTDVSTDETSTSETEQSDSSSGDDISSKWNTVRQKDDFITPTNTKMLHKLSEKQVEKLGAVSNRLVSKDSRLPVNGGIGIGPRVSNSPGNDPTPRVNDSPWGHAISSFPDNLGGLCSGTVREYATSRSVVGSDYEKSSNSCFLQSRSVGINQLSQHDGVQLHSSPYQPCEHIGLNSTKVKTPTFTIASSGQTGRVTTCGMTDTTVTPTNSLTKPQLADGWFQLVKKRLTYDLGTVESQQASKVEPAHTLKMTGQLATDINELHRVQRNMQGALEQYLAQKVLDMEKCGNSMYDIDLKQLASASLNWDYHEGKYLVTPGPSIRGKEIARDQQLIQGSVTGEPGCGGWPPSTSYHGLPLAERIRSGDGLSVGLLLNLLAADTNREWDEPTNSVGKPRSIVRVSEYEFEHKLNCLLCKKYDKLAAHVLGAGRGDELSRVLSDPIRDDFFTLREYFNYFELSREHRLDIREKIQCNILAGLVNPEHERRCSALVRDLVEEIATLARDWWPAPQSVQYKVKLLLRKVIDGRYTGDANADTVLPDQRAMEAIVQSADDGSKSAVGRERALDSRTGRHNPPVSTARRHDSLFEPPTGGTIDDLQRSSVQPPQHYPAMVDRSPRTTNVTTELTHQQIPIHPADFNSNCRLKNMLTTGQPAHLAREEPEHRGNLEITNQLQYQAVPLPPGGWEGGYKAVGEQVKTQTFGTEVDFVQMTQKMQPKDNIPYGSCYPVLQAESQRERNSLVYGEKLEMTQAGHFTDREEWDIGHERDSQLQRRQYEIQAPITSTRLEAVGQPLEMAQIVEAAVSRALAAQGIANARERLERKAEMEQMSAKLQTIEEEVKKHNHIQSTPHTNRSTTQGTLMLDDLCNTHGQTMSNALYISDDRSGQPGQSIHDKPSGQPSVNQNQAELPEAQQGGPDDGIPVSVEISDRGIPRDHGGNASNLHVRKTVPEFLQPGQMLDTPGGQMPGDHVQVITYNVNMMAPDQTASQQPHDELCLADCLEQVDSFDSPSTIWTWQSWRGRVERLQRDNKLSEKAFYTLVRSKLVGKADDIIIRADSGRTTALTTAEVLDKLEHEFVGPVAMAVAEERLWKMVQQSDETAKEFGNRLEEVAFIAFPRDCKERSTAIIKRLRQGLRCQQLISVVIYYTKEHPKTVISDLLDELDLHDPVNNAKIRDANKVLPAMARMPESQNHEAAEKIEELEQSGFRLDTKACDRESFQMTSPCPDRRNLGTGTPKRKEGGKNNQKAKKLNRRDTKPQDLGPQATCLNCYKKGYFAYKCPSANGRIHLCNACHQKYPEKTLPMYEPNGCLYCAENVQDREGYVRVLTRYYLHRRETDKSAGSQLAKESVGGELSEQTAAVATKMRKRRPRRKRRSDKSESSNKDSASSRQEEGTSTKEGVSNGDVPIGVKPDATLVTTGGERHVRVNNGWTADGTPHKPLDGSDIKVTHGSGIAGLGENSLDGVTTPSNEHGDKAAEPEPSQMRVTDCTNTHPVQGTQPDFVDETLTETADDTRPSDVARKRCAKLPLRAEANRGNVTDDSQESVPAGDPEAVKVTAEKVAPTLTIDPCPADGDNQTSVFRHWVHEQMDATPDLVNPYLVTSKGVGSSPRVVAPGLKIKMPDISTSGCRTSESGAYIATPRVIGERAGEFEIQHAPSPPVCRAQINMAEQNLDVCIDSGATFSILSKASYDRVKHTAMVTGIQPTISKLVSYASKTLAVDGWCDMQFYLDSFRFRHRVLVGRLEGVDMLLGQDWLMDNGAEVNLSTITLELATGTRYETTLKLQTITGVESSAYKARLVPGPVICPEQPDIECVDGFVRVRTGTTLPAGETTKVRCRVEGYWPQNTSGHLESLIELGKGIYVLNALITPDYPLNHVIVGVQNTTMQDWDVGSDIVLGRIEPLDKFPESQGNVHTTKSSKTQRSMAIWNVAAETVAPVRKNDPVQHSIWVSPKYSETNLVRENGGGETLDGLGRNTYYHKRVLTWQGKCMEDIKANQASEHAYHVIGSNGRRIYTVKINGDGPKEVVVHAGGHSQKWTDPSMVDDSTLLMSSSSDDPIVSPDVPRGTYHVRIEDVGPENEGVVEESGQAEWLHLGHNTDQHDLPQPNVVKNYTLILERLPEHLRCMLPPDGILSEEELKKLVELILQYQDIFVSPDGKVSITDKISHKIVTEGEPCMSQPREKTRQQKKLVNEKIAELLKEGRIKPSKSPWGAPVVLVRKKDGTLRFCIDFRRLNEKTKKDAYPIPRIDECLDSLNGSKFFSTLDLASGYWQVAMHPDDREKTGFITHKGLFEWIVMPFGLCNAPATFCRLMELCLADIVWTKCLVYLDDIIAFGDGFRTAMNNLHAVFIRLRAASLKLKPKKCALFRTKVEYLGHEVTRQGIRPSAQKVAELKTWKMPTNLRGLRSFLGFASYYRKFVKNFSMLAAPLNKLMKKGVLFEMTKECQETVRAISAILLSRPLLHYTVPDIPFVLETDASDTAIGACLSQTVDGEERPIAFASKTLSMSRRNYCTTKRELYAIVYFLQYWRSYTALTEVLIRTDHGCLTWLMKTGKSRGGNPMYARWNVAIEHHEWKIAPPNNADVETRIATHNTPYGKPRKDCGYPECRQCKLQFRLSDSKRGLVVDSIDDSEDIGDDMRPDPHDYAVWDLVLTRKQASQEAQSFKPESEPPEPRQNMGDQPRRSGRLQAKKLVMKAKRDKEVMAPDPPKPVKRKSFRTRQRQNARRNEFKQEKRRSVRQAAKEAKAKRPVIGTPEVTPVRSTPGEEEARDIEPSSNDEGQIPESKPTREETGTEHGQAKSPPKVNPNIPPYDPADVSWTKEDWLDAQATDAVIGRLKDLMTNYGQTKPIRKELLAEIQPVRFLCRHWDMLQYDHEGILCRRVPVNCINDTIGYLYQRIVPAKWQKMLFVRIHRMECMHMGYDRVYAMVQARYYWYDMSNDILDWTKSCKNCQQSKRGVGGSKNPYKQEFVSAPMLRLGMDLQGPFPTSKGQNKYILVIQDYWSRWVELFAIPDKQAITVAEILVNEIFTRYGVCWKLHSDQGMEFEASLTHELCRMWGVKKTRTSPFAPWSNGMVERSNKTIKQMLRQAVLENYRDDWDTKLPFIRMSLNNTVHATTGVTPHELFFSRCERARLPVDLLCGPPPQGEYVGCEREYIVHQRRRCQEVCEMARRINKKQCAFQKSSNARGGLKIRKYRAGDMVWRLIPPNERDKTGKTIWSGPTKVLEAQNDDHIVLLKIKAPGRGTEMNMKWINTSNVKPVKYAKKGEHVFSIIPPEQDWFGDAVTNGSNGPQSKIARAAG